MKSYLPEGRILKVYHGGSHDVFHVSLMPQVGSEHRHHHIKYKYDTCVFFDQEPCWHSQDNPCPAIKQFEFES